MLKRLRSDAGQTAAEYMGVLLLVAAIIAAIVLTPVGERIAYESKILICKIGGGENCAATAGNPDAPKLAKCVVSASDRSLEASVKVFVFKAEGGVAGVKRVSADGTTYITLKANGGAGLEFSSPCASAEGGGASASSPHGEV